MADTTPKQLAMARRIAADTLLRPEKWLPGVKAGIHEEIIGGMHDNEPLIQSALTAIIEATERAAQWLDDWGDATMGQEIGSYYAAAALRKGNHLHDH